MTEHVLLAALGNTQHQSESAHRSSALSSKPIKLRFTQISFRLSGQIERSTILKLINSLPEETKLAIVFPLTYLIMSVRRRDHIVTPPTWKETSVL